MAFDHEQFGVSLPFAQALKSAFNFHEVKIISALSFDIIGIIPYLSEGGIMEPSLRKLMIERNLVSSAKSSLVLHRIHEMGAIGYVRFVVSLQRNQSNVVYHILADQLLVAAQELYESWCSGLYSCRHLHASEGRLSEHGVTFHTSAQLTSVPGDVRLPGESAAVQPNVYHLPDTVKALPHNALYLHSNVSRSKLSVHTTKRTLDTTSNLFTPMPDAVLHCNAVTPSITCFTEESVSILVQRFCESGGSQMERVGAEKTFRTLMWQAKASRDNGKLVNQVKVYKCCYLVEVLQYYCQHGKRTTQHVHITERLEDLMSSIDTDTLSPPLTTSLQNIKDVLQHL